MTNTPTHQEKELREERKLELRPNRHTKNFETFVWLLEQNKAGKAAILSCPSGNIYTQKAHDNARSQDLARLKGEVEKLKLNDHSDEGREAYHGSDKYHFPDINLKLVEGMGYNRALSAVLEVIDNYQSKD